MTIYAERLKKPDIIFVSNLVLNEIAVNLSFLCVKFNYSRLGRIEIFSSPEPKAQGELIVYQSSRRQSVCLAGCVSTFSNSNISATSGPIVTKFYLNHHWGRGKAALGFGQDRIGTLVSMATDSSHRVIMGKML